MINNKGVFLDTNYVKESSSISKRITSGACATIIFASVFVNDQQHFLNNTVQSNAIQIDSSYSSSRLSHSFGNMCFSYDGDFSMSAKLNYNLCKLNEIAALRENWNGNGAEPFSNGIIRAMQKIVLSLSHQPSIFPTARKSIQFEYEKPNGDYLEFELFEDGRIKKFFCDAVYRSTTEFINAEDIEKAVNNYYNA